MGSNRRYSDYTDANAQETLVVLAILVAVLAKVLDWNRGLEAVILVLAMALLLPWPIKRMTFGVVWAVDLFGKFMSMVILAALYIVVFTPVAVGRRIVKYIFKRERDRSSWFVEREEQSPSAESFTRPF